MSQRMSAAEYRQQVVGELPESVLNYPVKKKSSVKRSMPEPTEHEIQSTILDRLKYLPKAFFWRENSGLMTAEYKGVKRMWRAGIPGIADIMGILDGYMVAIEVKRPGKKQSPDQLAFQRRLEACGGVYVVCSDATKIANQILAVISMIKGE